MERLNRRSFMKVAGAATGAAAIAAAPPIARAAMGDGAEIEATSDVPYEPVVAYIRDAKRGEVTVSSGTTERTYRDRALVEKLRRAARKGTM